MAGMTGNTQGSLLWPANWVFLFATRPKVYTLMGYTTYKRSDCMPIEVSTLKVMGISCRHCENSVKKISRLFKRC